MAAKKNGQTGGEDAPPVETKPLEADSDQRLAKLREGRRALEGELATIDAEIRQAINDGNLTALDKLSARKAELPRLYIAASTSEMAARQSMASAEDRANLEHLRVTEDKRDELRAAVVKMKARHEEELAALTEELNAVIAEVGATYSAIQSSRDFSASCDDGFKRAMAAITGV